MKIFIQILFGKKMMVFSSEFEKSHYKKQQHKIRPLPYTHTTQNKIQHAKVSISGPQGKGTQISYKTIKSCVIVDFFVED